MSYLDRSRPHAFSLVVASIFPAIVIVIELATGKNTKVASEPFYSPLNPMRANWSPDSRWLKP